MAEQLYNFSDYYQTNTAEAEIKIDMSGIPLKTQATSPDEDGTEIALNEVVTNNVCYYIAEIEYKTSGGATSTITTSDFTKDQTYVQITKTEYTPDGKTSPAAYTFIKVGYVMDALLEAELVLPDDTNLARLSDTIVADAGDKDTLRPKIEIAVYKQPDDERRVTNIKLAEASEIVVKYVPRYAMMADPKKDSKPLYEYTNTESDTYNSYPQAQNFDFQQKSWQLMKASMAALGFFGKREMSYKWLRKNVSKNSRAVWHYDNFRKTLKFIENYIGDANFGFNVVYYDTNYWDDSAMEHDVTKSDGTVVKEAIVDATRKDYKKDRLKAYAKHYRYLKALDEADYTKTTMTTSTKYADLSTHLDAFLKQKKVSEKGIVDYVNGLQENNGTGSALIPNVCDAFKAFYIPKETLVSDFNEAFSNVLSGIYELPITGAVLRRMSSRNRNRINLLRRSTLIKRTDDKPEYMLDMNEFCYSLEQSYAAKSAGNTKSRGFGLIHSRYIPEFGSTVYITEQTTGEDGKVFKQNVRRYKMFGTDSEQSNAVKKDYPKKNPTEHNVPVNASWYPVPPDRSKNHVPNNSYFSTMNALYYAEFNNKSKKLTDYDKTVDELINDYKIDFTIYDEAKFIGTLTSWYNIWYRVLNSNFANYEWYVDFELTKEYGKGGYIVGVRKIDESLDDAGGIDTQYLDYYWTFMPAASDKKNRYAKIKKSEIKNSTPKEEANPIEGDSIFTYIQTLAQYVDQACIVMHRLKNKTQKQYGMLPNDGVSATFDDGETVNVIKWDSYPWTDADNKCPKRGYNNDDKYIGSDGTPDYNRMVPMYQCDTDISNQPEFNMDFIVSKVIDEAFPEALSVAAIYANRFSLDSLIGDDDLKILSAIEDLRDELAKLKNVIDRIRYYQYFTNESVFENLGVIRDAVSMFDFKKVPARFMIPMLMYKKVRVKYKRWGRTRHRMVKRYIGIRWADVRLIDGNILSSYPQVDEGSFKEVIIRKNGTFNTYNDHMEVIFGEATDGFDYEETSDDWNEDEVSATEGIKPNTEGVLIVGDPNDRKNPPDTIDVVFISSTEFHCKDKDQYEFFEDGSKHYVYSFRTALDPTRSDDARQPVRLVYDMPYLPYPDEIRFKSFIDYGAFDQSRFAVKNRSGGEFRGYTAADGTFIFDRDADGNLIPEDQLDGWKLFHDSSKRIKDLRDGLGIHHAVAMLLTILKHEFGEQRVMLIETMRSKEDEALQCTGSGESEFLSWHNYGLAVKILILKEDLRNTIEQDSEDMWKLIDVAEAFTEACRTAKICPKPLNVVWCGRLVMGANNFVWEFLPIGVNHKDAPKFRDAFMAQKDPVVEYGFVDVDEEGYVLKKKPAADYTKPYVLADSNVYTDAIVINGHHFVNPAHIVNFERPRNLPLINVIEYIKMIELKMAANGTTLTERANIYDWKALSNDSFNQLITFFGMIGNFSGVHTLLGGDFVETYQNTVDMWFSSNHVEFVKEFLGDAYYTAKIFVQNSGNGGAYILLHDGRLHIKISEMHSKYDPRYDKNFFGARQTDMTKLERGEYIKGVFYNDEDLKARGIESEYVTEDPVISGYERDDDGNIVITGGDGLLLHSLITTQLKNVYDKLKERFENYNGKLLYDRFIDGPNYKLFDMLENEFGLIAAQDLTSFERLRTMLAKNDINTGASLGSSFSSNGNGASVNAGANEEDGGFLQNDPNGYRYDSIYEKVVSNALLSGVRKASLTKEHVEQTVKPGSLNVEKMYKLINQGMKVNANDLLG